MSVTMMTAFAGEHMLATGEPAKVALAVKLASEAAGQGAILVFDDATGRQVDFDLRGSDAEISARLQTPEPKPDAHSGKPSGRPRLGVVSREVTLLPRHWDWLADQPGGASVTIRRLVDSARTSRDGIARQAQQTADRFMSAILGNQPGYEEASRALYAGDSGRFTALTEVWPADLRDHARRLAAPAWQDDSPARSHTLS